MRLCSSYAPHATAPSPYLEKLPRRIEHAQDTQLFVGWRLRGGQRVGDQHLEAGIGVDLVDAHAGVQRLEAHPPALRVETKDAERRDHASHAAEQKPAPPPCVP